MLGLSKFYILGSNLHLAQGPKFLKTALHECNSEQLHATQNKQKTHLEYKGKF
jgi:hypothetical protein